MQAPSSCSVCCTRLPDAAAAAYVMPSDPLGRLVLPPPSATGGSYFAVMDPNPCCCNERTSLVRRGQAGDNSVRSKNENGSWGRGKGKRKEKRGPEADDATSVPPELFPPVLWPHLGGGTLANSRQYGKLIHGLRLRSAYAQQTDAWGTGEPAFTSFHHLFKVSRKRRTVFMCALDVCFLNKITSVLPVGSLFAPRLGIRRKSSSELAVSKALVL